MSELFDEISHLAQQLPAEERALLAEELLGSLQAAHPDDVEAAWDVELKSRIAAYESGASKLVPAKSVFARAKQLSQ